MALSYTYRELQTQIIDELGDRADLLVPLLTTASASSPIKRAIQSAIAKWEREPFYFNEMYNSSTPLFTTVAGQELYTTAAAAGIVTAPEINELRALVSGTYRVLTKRSWAYLSDISSNPTSRGQPDEWAYLASNIRLYPIPDGAYQVGATRLQRLTALAADADTNVWTQDGFDLIRCEALANLGHGILKDPALAAQAEAQIYGPRGYLYALKAETTRRAKSGTKPTQF
jgi:hypothetical protein